jgi:hypothetical protein
MGWMNIFKKCLSRIFHTYGDVTIAGEREQNSGLCSAFMTFEHGDIVPYLLRWGTSVLGASSKDLPHLVCFLRVMYSKHGMLRTYPYSDS